jgi:hypothetical protein
MPFPVSSVAPVLLGLGLLGFLVMTGVAFVTSRSEPGVPGAEVPDRDASGWRPW